MRNIVNSYMRKFKEERRKRWKVTGVLLALALVVTVGVFWQLHATGIAQSNEVYCGLEEHTHSADCYESVLVCGLEESEGHTHTADCYEIEQVLICGLEESEGHMHDESCYDKDGKLICELEETEGHTHTDGCYETEQVLICELETSEAHTHTEDCYEYQLICGLEEHTHTVECLSDDTADVETASDWESALPELTGELADDIVAIAQSQLGYTESTKNFILADDGETKQGYTRYGAWYGSGFEYVDWDAMFASFCLSYAGIDEDSFPLNSGAYSWAAALESRGFYVHAADHTPAAGDIVFFDEDGDGRADRVGVVAQAGEGSSRITVIEGDYAGNGTDRVAQNKYSVDDGTILGYGMLTQETDGEDAGENTAAATGTDHDLMLQTIDCEITADADSLVCEVTRITLSGFMPEEATATAEPVTVEIEGVAVACAYDISICDADGNTFEPEEDLPITVSFYSGTLSGEDSPYTVYYVSDEGEAEALETSGTGTGLEFEAEHFSTYAIGEEENGISTASDEGETLTALAASSVTLTPVSKGSAVSDSETATSGDGSLTVTVSPPSSGYTDYTDAAGYTYYTGETATVQISLSNTNNEALTDRVVRVYVQFEDTDGAMNYTTGEKTFSVTDGSGATTTIKGTITDLGDGLYCIEFAGSDLGYGTTFNLDLGISYPNYSSVGGSARIYTEIVDTETAEKSDYPQSTAYDCLLLTWITEPNSFSVDKEVGTEAAYFSGDGTGAYTYLKGLMYSISYNIDTTTHAYANTYGEDVVTSVDFTDTFTLPDELTWRDGVIDAIAVGNYDVKLNASDRYYYVTVEVGGETIELFHSSRQPSSVTATYDETTQKYTLVITWSVENSSTTSEISVSETYIYFGDEVIVAVDNMVEGKAVTISNSVSETTHYTYSEKKTTADTAEVTVTVGAADFDVEKLVEGYTTIYSAYMGQTYEFTINVYNDGVLAYDSIGTVSDTLSEWMYIEPDDMQALFNADADHQLVITLTNATLCTSVSKSVTDEDGGSSAVTQQYTGTATDHDGLVTDADSDLITSDATITIGWSDDYSCLVLTYSYDNGTAVTESVTIGESGCDYTSISAALDGIGYVVTSAVTYNLTWDLGATELKGGETITYTYNATVKNTFMRLNVDQWWYLIDSGSAAASAALNTVEVTAYQEPGSTGTPDTRTDEITANYIWRDFTLTKTASRDGTELDSEDDSVSVGDLLTYSVTVGQYNTPAYSALPLVDHMEGTQVLAVPVSLNADLASYSLETVTVDGTDYYVLSEGGTYSNVVLNASGTVADNVVVTANSNGTWDTLIYVYLSLDETSGSATTVIEYNALVMVTDESTSASDGYSIDLTNEVWLGDHEMHRLYDMVPLKGYVYEIQKDIVSENDEEKDPDDDVLVDSRRTTLTEGETVQYRFTISSSGSLTLTGNDIYDALPENVSGDPWDESDITVWFVNVNEDGEVITSETTDADYADLAAALRNWETQSTDGANGSGWYVSQTNLYPSINDRSENEDTQQYLYWTSGLTVTFTGTLYIYVTLDMPEGSDWNSFAQTYSAGNLTNTLYVFELYSQVYHDVDVTSSVYLHKGVASTGVMSYSSNTKKYTIYDSTDEDSLYYYSNNGSVYLGFVQYYVVLYNEGPNNLYINEMQDVLPEGFSYFSADGYTVCSTLPVTVTTGDGDTKVTGKYFDVFGEADDTTNIVTFTISQYTGTSTNSIGYDSNVGMCYLEPGEALVFTFYCTTNGYEDTEDFATNTVAMPFYDYTGGGVQVSGDDVYVTTSGTMTQNDGECVLAGSTWALSEGLTVGSNDKQWLYSKVTVTREKIVPGITKSVTKAGDVDNPTSAGSTDTLQWTVTVSNTGSATLANYTLTDVMDYPYTFSGQFIYNINTGTNYGALSASYRMNLFQITSSSETSLKIQYATNPNSGWTGKTATITIGGDPVTLERTTNIGGTTVTWYMYVAFYYDSEGNMVFEITFEGDAAALIPGAYATLTFYTTPGDDTYSNATYYNTAYITPTQSYDTDDVTQGVNVTKESETYNESEGLSYVDGPSVRAVAQIPVFYGSATTSIKYVTETEDTTNMADSQSSTGSNYITLSDEEDAFYYTLVVNNGSASSGSAMKTLTIIDSLPEIGDHAVFAESEKRYSAFKVVLADSPNVTVTVTASDGATWTLMADTDYTVMYSTKTEFTTSGDWDNSSNEDWYTWAQVTSGSITGLSIDTVRSIRIVFNLYESGSYRTTEVNSTTYTLIPAGASVKVTFNAKIASDQDEDGDVDSDDMISPLAIAWNSFGYYYSTADTASYQAAAPMYVGVQVPGTPRLVKELTQSDGSTTSSATAEEDETFRFLIYYANGSTSEVTLTDDMTETQIAAALEAAGYIYTYAAVTVSAGESTSDTLYLKGLKQYTYDAAGDGWTATNNDWEWKTGASYTIMELANGNDSVYDFSTWNTTTASNSYTFTYDYTTSLKLTCVNSQPVWTLSLQKVDEETESLELKGALFALYTSDASAALAESSLTEEQTALLTAAGLTFSDVSTITVDGNGAEVEAGTEGSTTWYLYALSATDDDGMISWSGLDQESYYLKELAAPEDYAVTESGALQLVSNTGFTYGSVGVTVTNKYNVSYELPLSGGAGAGRFALIGLALIGGAGLLYFRRRHFHI